MYIYRKEFRVTPNLATFWGDGNRPIDATSVEDTAWMTARVALDRDVPAGKFAFYGDRLSFNDFADVAERITGKAFERRSLGTEADLRAAMAAADPGARVMLAYSLYMANGQTSLDDVQNGRYPDLHLQTFETFAGTRLG